MSSHRFSLNAMRSVGIGLLALLPVMLLPAIFVRTLPAADIAAWSYALSIAAYVMHFHLGVGPATATLVGRHHLNTGKSIALLAGATTTLVLASVLAATFLIALDRAGLFASPLTEAIGDGGWRLLFMLAIGGATLLLPLQGFSGYCQGIFRVDRLIPINVIRHGATAVLCAMAAIIFGRAGAVAIAFFSASAICLAVTLLIVRRELLGALSKTPEPMVKHWPALMALAIPAALSGLAQVPVGGLHAVLISKFQADAIVAFATIASTLALTSGFVWAILSNLLPELSSRTGSETERRNSIGQTISQGTPVLAVSLFVVITALTSGLPFLLTWVLTSEYVATHLLPLLAYAVIMIVREINLPMTLSALAIDRAWLSLLPVYAETAIGVAVTIVLMPNYGISGIIIAMTIAISIGSLLRVALLSLLGVLNRQQVTSLLASTLAAVLFSVVMNLILLRLHVHLDLHQSSDLALLSLACLVMGCGFSVFYWFAIVPRQARAQCYRTAQRFAIGLRRRFNPTHEGQAK